MKTISKKTKAVVAKATQAHKAAKAAKGAKAAAKQEKTVKAVELSSAVKALKAGSLLVAVLDGGAKGRVMRRVKYEGAGIFKLIQDNKGLVKTYDGARFSLDAQNKLVADAQGRLEAGNYCCSKGGRATVSLLSEQAARKLCSKKIVIERNGKQVALAVSDVDKQYACSIERLGNGQDHFFQWESARLKTNALHFGQIVKG